MPLCMELQSCRYGNGFRFGRTISCYCIFICLLLSGLFSCTFSQEGGAPISEGGPSSTGEGSSVCPQRGEGASCTCTEVAVDCTSIGFYTVPYNLGTSIQQLIFANNLISSIDSITSQYLPSLLYIDASYNSISSVDWSSFSSLATLEEMYLQMNSIFWVDLSQFYGSKLKILNVSGNELTYIYDGERELPLEQLYIENCGLTNFNFGASISLCKLKILHIGGNTIGTLPESALSCMADLEQIKLNNCDLTSLSEDTFSYNTLIQYIDLSNNRLSSLPSRIFDGLDMLMEINLSGNPWLCDCNLMALRIFLDNIAALGGTIVDEDVTYCHSESSEGLATLTGISTFQISECGENPGKPRWRRAADQGISRLNWFIKCQTLLAKNSTFVCGPSKVASCVYDFPSTNYSLVQYVSELQGLTTKSECRDVCYSSDFHYFVYLESSSDCLCGQPISIVGCADCTYTSTASGAGLCNNEFSNIGDDGASFLYDFSVTFSPPAPQVFTEVIFTLSGGPSDLTSVSWDFGDGTSVSVLNGKTASHSYSYPGTFEVSMILASTSSSASVLTSQVNIQITIVSTSDHGLLSCPNTVSTFEAVNISTTYSTAWLQIVSWIREDKSSSSNQPTSEGRSSECESGWVNFRDRCIQVQNSAITMSSANTQCLQQGARLLRLHSTTEIEEIISLSSLLGSGTYFIGAEWNTNKMVYYWKYSSSKAFVFKEVLASADAGNCVTVSTIGLNGEDCSAQLPYICEKDPVFCMGSQSSGGTTCYVVKDQSVLRDEAEEICQSSYTNGHLVMISDSTENAYVTLLLSRESMTSAWIGLKAASVENHYTWDKYGFLPTSYENWDSGAGVEPCVVINSSGYWSPDLCGRTYGYICEYYVADTIKVPTLMAGTVPVSDDSVISTSVSEVASLSSLSSSTVTIMPESWVSKSGQVLRWNIQTRTLTNPTQIALQIWRPICNSGSLDRPGCNSQSPMFTCAISQSVDCSSLDCEEGQYFCLLTQMCLPITEPCSCANTSVSATIVDCQGTTINSNTAWFQLVSTTAITVPSQTALIHFTPSVETTLQLGDVLGFQTDGSDVVICETPSVSIWRHNVLISNSGGWQSVNDTVDPQTYLLSENVLCKINVVYTTEKQISTPHMLNYITEAGDYEFTIQEEDWTNSSSLLPSHSCTVSAMDIIDGLMWVYPDAAGSTSAVFGSTDYSVNIVINVEADTSQDLIIKLFRGTNPTIKWTFGNDSAIYLPFTSSCSSSIEACQYQSSFLSSPYSSTSHTFSGSTPSTVAVTASNDISFKTLNVTVYAFSPITAVQFYHEDCVDFSNCVVTVETSVNQVFHMVVKSGDVQSITYDGNSTTITPLSSNSSVIQTSFQQPGLYLLEVNVSNPVSFKVCNVTVLARVKANFVSVRITSVLTKAAMGVPVDILAEAEITRDAFYQTTWFYGDNNVSSVVELAAGGVATVSSLDTIFNTTGNVTVSVLLEDAFGDSVSTSMIVEVYKAIDSIGLNATPSVVGTTENVTVSIVIDNLNGVNTYHYGPMHFTVDFGDGTLVVSWTSMISVQEIYHNFSGVGTFIISVSASSDFDPTNIIYVTDSIRVEEKIKGLSLTYDGPKHVNDYIIFTLNQTSGTDIEYTLNYGNGNTSASQTGNSIMYQYSVAAVYTAVLTAVNSVSTATTSLTLYAYDENLLEIISISSRRCVEVNSSVDISSRVAAESPQSLNYSWSFGNGQVDSGIGSSSVTTAYPYIGLFTINLNVTNHTSGNADSCVKEICVEEKITGLYVSYRNPIALNQPGAIEYVEFIASVTYGSNLTYIWNVNSEKDVGIYDTLNLTVTEAMTYTIEVKVANDLNTKVKRIELVAMEVISGLAIECNTCISAIYAETNRNISFSSMLIYGTDESNHWSFSDSNVTLESGSVQHVFSSCGNYTVSLQSDNNVSSSSATLDIIAQDLVVGLNIIVSSLSARLNDSIDFLASVSAGSHLAFTWTCDLVVMSTATSNVLSHSFTSPGFHNCTVRVYNDLSSEETTSTISVLDEITALDIDHKLVSAAGGSELFAATNEELEFTAISNTNFLVNYNWTVSKDGQPIITLTGQTVKYTFQTLGLFEISVNASSDKYSKETSLSVEVLEGITNLAIQSNISTHMVFANETVSFVATMDSGSNTSIQWSLDSSALASTDKMTNIKFSNPGEFTVQVMVKNKLGSVSATLTMFVYIRVSGVAIIVQQQDVNLPYISEGTDLDMASPTVEGTSLIYNWTVVHIPTYNVFSSNLSHLPFTFNQSGTYSIKLNVTNPLSSGEDEFNVEVQGPITHVEFNTSGLLVASGASVYFGTVLNSGATDVAYTWSLAGTVKHVSDFLMQFPVLGVYHIYLTVENEVSQINISTILRVLDPISNLQILNCGLVKEVQTYTPIEAVIDLGTNVSFTWFVEMDGRNTTMEGRNTTVIFQDEGLYMIHLKAENDLGEATKTCQMELHLPIGAVTLAVSYPQLDYIFQNHNVTFTASGNSFRFATFHWNFTNQAEYISSSSSYTRSFANIGDYTLTLTISNNVSNVQATLDFTVQKFLCQLPEVTRVGNDRRIIQRSHLLELEVAVDPKGCTEYLAVHMWSIFLADDCQGDLDSSQLVDLGDTTTSCPALLIKPRVLDVGLYCVLFETSYHYTSVSETEYYMINVTASPLKAVIKGGDRRTVAIGDTLCMDGSLSYDPDDTTSMQSSLQYEWQCSVVSSSGNCFLTSSQIQYCYQGFVPGEYRLHLKVKAASREAGTAEQTIVVLNVTDFVPLASIVCESCASLGNYRVSSSQHVALSAACENCVCQPDFLWKVFEEQAEVALNGSHTSTGVNSQNLVLNKWGALKDGMNYTFVVYVTCQNSSSSTGTASFILPANLPPTGGFCTFSPTTIIPLVDQVIVSCHNWFDMDDPDTVILYKIYASTTDPVTALNQTYLLYTGTDATQAVYLGSLSDESVVLSAMVSDEFGAVTLGGLSTIKIQTINLAGSGSITDYLLTQTDTVLSGLVKQSSPMSVLQYAIALGQQLNTESQKVDDMQFAGHGTIAEQMRAAIRDAVTICLSTSVPISTLQDVQQLAFALRLLTDYSIEYLTEDSQRLMATTLESMSDVMKQLVTNSLGREDVPTEDLLSVIINLISAVNARVYSSSEIWESGRNITLNDFSTNFLTLRPEISTAVSGLQFVDIDLNENHRKSIATSTLPLLEDILVSTLRTMMLDEDGIEMEIGDTRVRGYRSYAKDLILVDVSDTSQITVPSSILSAQKDDWDEILQIFISHGQNPYTFDYLNDEMSSMPVQALSFYETNGSYINVIDLEESSRVHMYMFTNNAAVPEVQQGMLLASSVYDPLKDISYKTVRIKPEASQLFQVPDTENFAASGVGLHIQLRIAFLPNTTGNLSAVSFGSNVSVYLGVNFSPSANTYSRKLTLTSNLMILGTDHREYTFFFNDLSSSDQLYVVATNEDSYHEVDLSVAVYFSSCSYFDTTQSMWSYQGCVAQNESITTVTACVCDHLTSFGAVGIVSISDIDFADLENLNFATNPVVFIAIAVIFVLYILAAIICRYLDALDLRRISRMPLCGMDGAFKYEVTVVTGRCYNAGTSSHIGIKLYGDENKGEARHLAKPGAFQRNCHDTFLIAHDTNLGDITKLLVWHDNTGLNPSWFLSHVVIKDIQTGSRYTFLVNSWFSLEMKDGVIQKTVKAADKEEIKRFKLQFGTIFYGMLADLHVWLSVSNRPDHSRFTRVQRATCCLTSVYLYMCINAMWYGVIKDRAEVDQPLTWNSFGWEEVVIAIISTISVLPFLFGLSFMFKKSRCKESMFQEVLRPSTSQTIEIEAICDMSRDGGSYRTITPLGDWVPAADRESTTDSFAVPTSLKRTAPMHRGKRKGSSESATRERPLVSTNDKKKELWDKDNIMENWPDKMPSWFKQVQAEVKENSTADAKPNDLVAGGSGSRRQSQSSKTFHSGTRSVEDSDDNFEQQLDEIDAELTRAEMKKKQRKLSLEANPKQHSTEELFASDDEWVNEGLPFNPREEASLTSRRLASKSRTLHHSDSGASHRKEFPSYGDGTRPRIASLKSRGSERDHLGQNRSMSVTTHKSVKQQNFSFPPWCVYVAYAVCAQLCMLSIIMVLLYGYQFGKAVALKWIVSLCISLFASILVVEPLKVLVLTVFVALFTKDVKDEERDLIDVKPSVESNERIKDVKFRPLGGFALLQAKEEGRKKQRLQTMLREVFVFVLMLGLFMAIVFINFSSRSIYCTNYNIHNKFYYSVDDSHDGGRNFTNFKSIGEFWQWSQTVLARSVHHREVDTEESFGYLLGPPWLRQIRSKNVTCWAALETTMTSVPELTSRRCVSDASTDPDTEPYMVGWIPAVSGAAANWTFFSSGQLDMYSKFGWSLFYPGGGYVQWLGQTYNDTIAVLQQLEAQDWIDLSTRVVFVEFALYNPSADITSCITLVVEFPISGGVLTSSSIYTERFLRHITGVVDPLLVCQCFFTLFVIYLTVVLVQRLRAEKWKFLGQFWTWIDVFICSLAWSNLAIYTACVVMATERIDAFLANQTSPSSLGQVALLHAVLRYVHAFLLFLYLLKITKQISFARPLYKFYSTLSMASGSLMGVFLIFSLLLLTYAQLGYLIFGSLVHGYHSFQHSMMSLFGLLASRTDFWPLFESERILTHVIFLSFGLFVYGLTVSLCVAVLSWSYKWSHSQMSYKTTLEARDYEMIDFMIKRFKLLTGLQKPKPSFRHVKFEGLPSLPSRGTSSNLSLRQSCNSPASAASEPAESSEQNMDYLMASLLPTWNQVLHTFQKVEDLDKDLDNSCKKLQDAVKGWNGNMAFPPADNLRFKIDNSKPIMGKPPLDPKGNFHKFRKGGAGRNITIFAGRTSMTPPSTFTVQTPMGGKSWRPISDQGMRYDEATSGGEIIRLERPNSLTGPARPGAVSSTLHGDSSDTGNSSQPNSARSTKSEGKGTMMAILRVQGLDSTNGSRNTLPKQKKAWESHA